MPKTIEDIAEAIALETSMLMSKEYVQAVREGVVIACAIAADAQSANEARSSLAALAGDESFWDRLEDRAAEAARASVEAAREAGGFGG